MVEQSRPAWLWRSAQIACATLVVLCVCAAAQAATVEPLYGKGLLWRVEQTGLRPSYLFGTLHSSDPRVTRLPEPVAAVFGNATSLTIEVVRTPAVEAELLHARLLERGDNLAALVGPERFERVKEVGARYGLAEAQLRQFKPWALMTLFSVPPAELLGRRSSTALPLDWMLQERAEQRGIPVYGLESAAEQIGLFDELGAEAQIALLDDAITQNPRVDWWWQSFRDAYLARDVSAIFSLMTGQMAADDDELGRRFMRRAVDERNLRMVERMASRLAEGDAFIAVGSLHLRGEQGLLNLLAQRGYRVTRVY
jgi:uncharacterized protein